MSQNDRNETANANTEQKKLVAEQIKAAATRLNELLTVAYDLGLTVTAFSNTQMLNIGKPEVSVKISENIDL